MNSSMRRVAFGAAVAVAAVASSGRGARAQTPSFVEAVSEDACQQAATYDTDDESAAALHARRGCRLQRFADRLASERQAQLGASERRRLAALQTWMDATQPARVVRPISVEGFAGWGLATYGLAVTWMIFRRLELGGWLGFHHIEWTENVSSRGQTSYTSSTFGVGTRYFLTDADLSPFVGAGFAIGRAPLQVVSYSNDTGLSNFLQGHARENAVSASAGLQLALQGLRLSLEYVFAYAFYTQANLDDEQKSEDDTLRRVWQDSLDRDRHGLRFQVGYAF